MALLDSITYVSPATFALGPMRSTPEPTLVNISGVTLMHTPQGTPAAAEAALKSLRGFRAAGRRIAWCHTTELSRTPNVDLHAWGRKLVEQGKADMTVFCGAGARELALAARDAGLPLGRVIVCTDDATARNVLCDSISVGDTVLALGIAVESCQRLAERLESRFERELVGVK